MSFFSTKTFSKTTSVRQPACQPSLLITNTMVSESVTHLKQPFYIPLALQGIASIKKTNIQKQKKKPKTKTNNKEILRSHFLKSSKIQKYPTCTTIQQVFHFIFLLVNHFGQIFLHFKYFRKHEDGQSISLAHLGY